MWTGVLGREEEEPAWDSGEMGRRRKPKGGECLSNGESACAVSEPRDARRGLSGHPTRRWAGARAGGVSSVGHSQGHFHARAPRCWPRS